LAMRVRGHPSPLNALRNLPLGSEAQIQTWQESAGGGQKRLMSGSCQKTSYAGGIGPSSTVRPREEERVTGYLATGPLTAEQRRRVEALCRRHLESFLEQRGFTYDSISELLPAGSRRPRACGPPRWLPVGRSRRCGSVPSGQGCRFAARLDDVAHGRADPVSLPVRGQPLPLSPLGGVKRREELTLSRNTSSGAGRCMAGTDSLSLEPGVV